LILNDGFDKTKQHTPSQNRCGVPVILPLRSENSVASLGDSDPLKGGGSGKAKIGYLHCVILIMTLRAKIFVMKIYLC